MKSIFRRVHLIFVGFLKYKNWPYGHVTWVWMPNLKFKSWMNSAVGLCALQKNFGHRCRKWYSVVAKAESAISLPKIASFASRVESPGHSMLSKIFEKIIPVQEPPQHERSYHKGFKSLVVKAKSTISS